MIISEVLDAIDNINSITLESEITTCESLLNSYDKMMLIAENYSGDNDNLECFKIFQEGEKMDALKEDYKKQTQGKSTLNKIIFAIPRMIISLFRLITGKLKKIDSNIDKIEKHSKEYITVKDKNGKSKKILKGAAILFALGITSVAAYKNLPKIVKNKKKTVEKEKESLIQKFKGLIKKLKSEKLAKKCSDAFNKIKNKSKDKKTKKVPSSGKIENESQDQKKTSISVNKETNRITFFPTGDDIDPNDAKLLKEAEDILNEIIKADDLINLLDDCEDELETIGKAAISASKIYKTRADKIIHKEGSNNDMPEIAIYEKNGEIYMNCNIKHLNDLYQLWIPMIKNVCNYIESDGKNKSSLPDANSCMKKYFELVNKFVTETSLQSNITEYTKSLSGATNNINAQLTKLQNLCKNNIDDNLENDEGLVNAVNSIQVCGMSIVACLDAFNHTITNYMNLVSNNEINKLLGTDDSSSMFDKMTKDINLARDMMTDGDDDYGSFNYTDPFEDT
jgi:hypothetical protein